ncbi:hypothetical protein [Saccharothrix lopnurensis]|uniref:Uncharacterized protein n=1 Tax=Saccharothrix lopnurensis TaxID=1670621 RepID=A0ABW1PFG5_9PSEU
MTATTGSDQPPSPCDIQARPWSPHSRWSIGCRVHHCEAWADYPDEASARAAFCCDHGARWWFLVHHLDDDPPPALVDLTGLVDHVRTYIQNDALGQPCLLVVWRYLGGECRAVDVEITTTGKDEWLVHVTDAPDDVRRAGRSPRIYLTFHHILE